MTNFDLAPELSQVIDDYRKFEENEQFNDMLDEGGLGD